MASVIKYSGAYAKTCALRSELLKYGDFEKLAAAADVGAFAELLGEWDAYKDVVSEASEFGTNRIAIERSLSKSLYRDYAALYSFITDQNERRYLDVFFLKYSAGVIKRLLRWLFDHRDISKAIPKYESFVTRRVGLDIEKVERSTTLDELLESIKDTDFYGVIAKIDRQKATLFDYEMQLDFHCYIRTHACQEKTLSRKELLSARELNGSDVDLQNILWIYRAKTFYDIPYDEIFTYLIPIHYMLSSDIVKELVKSEGFEQFSEVLGRTHYRNVFTDFRTEKIEISARSYMNKLHDSERKKNPYSLISVVAHLYLKGQEIRNLTTLVECIRYKLSPQSSLDRLVLNYLPDYPKNTADAH